MSEACIILPVTAPNDFMWYVASVAIRTMAASTNGSIIVLANNTHDIKKRESLERQCSHLGARYEYIEGPFSLTKFFNMGIDKTTEPYMAFCNQDCVFYPGWLSNLIELWKEQPEYFALWPWSYYDHDYGEAYQQVIKYERRIVEHWQVDNVVVMRRDYGYRWDERFSCWEIEPDFQKYVKSKNYKIGRCLNSRVDHFSRTVTNNIDIARHYGDQDFYGNATRALTEKWHE